MGVTADIGDSTAKERLGIRYLNGEGVEPDLPKAYRLLAESCESGSTNAMVQLGSMYENGIYVEASGSEAIRMYSQAYRKGNVEGLCRIARMYFNGDLVPKDYGQAKGCIEGHLEDDAGCQCLMGEITEMEEGPFNFSGQSLYWLRCAADGGCAYALELLALRYCYGGVFSRDMDLSYQCFKRAADMGSAYSQFMLGRMTLDRQVEGSKKEGLRWIEAAAEQGYGPAFLMLGELHENGRFLERSAEKAFECYAKAYSRSEWRACQCLARMYEEGFGAEQDLDRALDLYTEYLWVLENGKGSYAMNKAEIECTEQDIRRVRWKLDSPRMTGTTLDSFA